MRSNTVPRYNHQYRDLDVWKKSIQLAKSIYSVTDTFPPKEIYGIAQQMRRSAVSIASNIAEGSRRQTHKEFTYFLHIAAGSTAELATQMIIASETGLITHDSYSTLDSAIDEIERMLAGLRKGIARRHASPSPLSTNS